MRKSLSYIFLSLAILAVSCSGNKGGADVSTHTNRNVSLKVNGNYVITLADENMQYCTGAHLFRAGNDDMSTYFSLSFDSYPSTEGESVGAELKWKESGTEQDRSGLKLSVTKVDGDVIWLSDTEGKVAAIIRKN